MNLSNLKALMKKSPFLMDSIAYIYRVFHYNNSWKYRFGGVIP